MITLQKFLIPFIYLRMDIQNYCYKSINIPSSYNIHTNIQNKISSQNMKVPKLQSQCTWEVGGDRWNAHNSAFSRCVTPRLIVWREYTQVASTDKFLIVHAKERIGDWQEFRMENDLKMIFKISNATFVFLGLLRECIIKQNTLCEAPKEGRKSILLLHIINISLGVYGILKKIDCKRLFS